MVALPSTISPTIAAIDAWHEGQRDDRHYPFIRGSLIGRCERHLFYLFRWAHAPEKFEGRILRLFETGQRAEAEMIRDLRHAGVDVQTSDPGTPGQIEVTALDGHFVGHLDGIANGILEAPKTPHLLECKTHNAKSFAQLVKHGVAASKPEHLAQMMVYMHLRSLTRGFYLAKNKDTDELYAERVRYDVAHALSLTAKAVRVKMANEPPARISDDPASFLCRFCPSHAVCHGGAWALRNCRTCLHSDPIEHGGWFCHRHKTALTREQQQRGCPSHRYLPGLLPGEQIDADEWGETVTYRMPDGSTWIDDGRAA